MTETAKEPADSQVTLGVISGVFGIKGWVKVKSYTRPADNLLDYRLWWIDAQPPFESRVIDARPQTGGHVAYLCGRDGKPIDDRGLAESLIGCEIRVDRAKLPRLPKGQFYWSELIGFEVVSIREQPLGVVEGLMESGAQDVLMLRDGRQQRLIPFVRGPIIIDVQLSSRRIVADWDPEF